MMDGKGSSPVGVAAGITIVASLLATAGWKPTVLSVAILSVAVYLISAARRAGNSTTGSDAPPGAGPAHRAASTVIVYLSQLPMSIGAASTAAEALAIVDELVADARSRRIGRLRAAAELMTLAIGVMRAGPRPGDLPGVVYRPPVDKLGLMTPTSVRPSGEDTLTLELGGVLIEVPVGHRRSARIAHSQVRVTWNRGQVIVIGQDGSNTIFMGGLEPGFDPWAA